MQCGLSNRRRTTANLTKNTKSARRGKGGRQMANFDHKCDACKGGVSALHLVYRGDPATLYSPDYPGFDALSSADSSCAIGSADKKRGKGGKGSGRGSDSGDIVIQFLRCDCLTGKGVEPCNASFVLDVRTGDGVCLAMVDQATGLPAFTTKFPTNLGFYHQPSSGAVAASFVHTSCSRPIYPPYAFSLSSCNDEADDFYLDLSSAVATDIGAAEPYMEFADGVSAKDPSIMLGSCHNPNECDCSLYPKSTGETSAPTTETPTVSPLPATLSGVVRSRTEGETGMPTESHQPWRARSAWTWAWGWGRRGTGRAAPDERRGGEARRIIGAGKKVGHWIAPPQCHRNRASRPLGPLPPTPTHRHRRLTTGLYVYMILTLIIYFTLG